MGQGLRFLILLGGGGVKVRHNSDLFFHLLRHSINHNCLSVNKFSFFMHFMLVCISNETEYCKERPLNAF